MNERDLQRLEKVLIYFNSQEELTELTKAHLQNVINNTGEAVETIFSKLVTMNETMGSFSEIITTLKQESDSVVGDYTQLIDKKEQFLEQLLSTNTNECDNDTIIAVRESIKRLKEMQTRLMDIGNTGLEKLSGKVSEFEYKILDTMAQLQFQDSTRQQIEIILKYLDDNISYMRCLCTCVKNGSNHCIHNCDVPAFKIDDILKYYVMESQREIHKKIVDSCREKSHHM